MGVGVTDAETGEFAGNPALNTVRTTVGVLSGTDTEWPLLTRHAHARATPDQA